MKLKIFIHSHNSSQALKSTLHPLIWKRIQAVKKLCLDTIKTEVQFHTKVFEVEKEFASKFQAILEKRKEVLTSDYTPTEDECKFPGNNLYQNEESEAQEVAGNCPTGIPNFWLDVLKMDEEIGKTIQKEDENALKHLIDIKVNIKDDLSYELNFYFEPNEFFENSVLTKTYFVKCELDEEFPFSFDGPEIHKTNGCEIRWKDGKNLTAKTSESIESPLKFFETLSFFNFFSPPTLSSEDPENDQEEIEAYLETDFEIGHNLKERIIPRAILFYLGEIEYENFSFGDYECHDDFITEETGEN